jgi:general L-amino acid transport system substrate-binding protein
LPPRSYIGGGRAHPHPPIQIHLIAVAILLFTLPASAASTLDRIRQTQTLRCGINQETPEYSTSDDHGPRLAFDADICRAVAIAILGPSARTLLTQYPDDVASMQALRDGVVDLVPTLTLDLTHSANTGIAFSPPLLYDGVAFLVPLTAKLTRPAQLSGRKICFLAETQVELAVRAWFSREHLRFVPFPFQEEGEMQAAFVTGNCAAIAGDRTRLAATRLGFGPLAPRYTLLPGQLSQDPLAAASPVADPAFAAIVFWTVEVLLNAEAEGLTQRNVATTLLLSSRSEAEGPASSSDPAMQFLTGRTGEIGSRLGLDNAWATQVISAVGNYGEIYDRDLGPRSPLKLPRTLNRLYSHGGLMVRVPLK